MNYIVKFLVIQITLFALMFLIRCNNNRKSLKYLICRDSIQYWNYEWPRERAAYFGFTFSFDKDGKVKKYSFSKIKNRRILFTDYHQTPDLTWSVSKDSILTFFGSSSKIVYYSEDTIIIEPFDSDKIKEMLIRVKGNLNINEQQFPTIIIDGDTVKRENMLDL